MKKILGIESLGIGKLTLHRPNIVKPSELSFERDLVTGKRYLVYLKIL